jgi:hypothetical protein
VPLVCYIISDLTDLTVCEYASWGKTTAKI